MAWPIGISRIHTGRAIAIGLVLVVGLVTGVGVQAADATSATRSALGPLIEKARGGQCVEDPAYMRRNHMRLLKHQRDDTLRGGIRTGKYSLKECVACHASQSNQSVNAEAGNFCQSCHVYAAVKIDCFECHANKPDVKAAQTSAPQKSGSGLGLMAQEQSMSEGAKP